MGKNGQEIFSYTYSASDQEEVKSIRKKYVPQTEDKMEQLKRLDMAVYKKASIISLTIGFIGVMLLGIGMCCTMVWVRAAKSALLISPSERKRFCKLW